MEAKNWQNLGMKAKSEVFLYQLLGLGNKRHCTAKQTIEKIWRKIQVRFNVAYNFLHYYRGPPAGHFPVRRRGTARLGNAAA